MKVVIGISGASGAKLGLELAFILDKICKTHLIISDGAKDVLHFENSLNLVDELANFRGKIYTNNNLAAPISSGSFMNDMVFITPCSINTLGKIASGISDTLITRVAAVALKQRQKLILGVREMPLSTLNLEQMARLSSYGAVIAPPIFGNYAAKNIKEVENFIIGKWLDSANIKHNIYKRWQGERE